MAATRRLGTEESTTRAVLLDAARDLLLTDGYAAVTSRKVAAHAGLKPQLVHYYFRTMDDLFIALVRQGAEDYLEQQTRALASTQPLRAFWALSSEPSGAALVMELMSLANHRKAIRAEIAAQAERFRRLQLDALTEVLERYGIDDTDLSAAALLVAITSISRVIVLEQALGMSVGHAETTALVERYLDELEPRA